MIKSDKAIFVANVCPRSLHQDVRSIYVEPNGNWICDHCDVAVGKNCGCTHHVERVIEGLRLGQWRYDSVVAFKGPWQVFWFWNVNSTQTLIGKAVLAALDLTPMLAGRYGGWQTANAIVQNWKNIDVGNDGRLEDPRLGTPVMGSQWWVEVEPLMFGRGRIWITDGLTIPEFWSYPSYANAVEAFQAWVDAGYQGEPEGWERAQTRDDIGRPIVFRRRPDLDPAKEYVAP